MIAPTTPDAGAIAPPPPKLAPMLAWLVDRATLDDDVRGAVNAKAPAALAEGAADPGLLAEALLDVEQGAAAARLVACALPPREGVWWAWLVARHAAQAGPPATAEEHAALAAIERWVGAPTDEHRRAAWDAAQVAGLDTAAGCVATAAYFTGGSVTPAGAPFVPPPPGMHAVVAGAAVALAAGRDPEQTATLLPRFVQQGIEVVRRLGGWEVSAGLAKQTYDAQAVQHAAVSAPPAAPATPPAR